MHRPRSRLLLALGLVSGLALLGTATRPAPTLQGVEVLPARHATVLFLHLNAPAPGFSHSVEGERLRVELPGVADGTRGAKLVVAGRHADYLRIVAGPAGVAVVVHPGSAAEPFRHHGVVKTQGGLIVVVGVDPLDESK